MNIGVLKEISARLADISPEKFIVPELDCQSGDHPVSMATDDIKRLHTLRCLLQNEVNGLVVSYIKTIAEAKARYQHVNNLDRELESADSPASKVLEEIERIKNEHSAAETLHDIVDNIFWLEVRRQSSELDNKSWVCIRSDWSLCWGDEDKSHILRTKDSSYAMAEALHATKH